MAAGTVDTFDPGHCLIQCREDRARHPRILGLAEAEADAIAVCFPPNRDQGRLSEGLGSEGFSDWHWWGSSGSVAGENGPAPERFPNGAFRRARRHCEERSDEAI
ncbi:MAG TPA: hypothetical protein VGN91_10560, partial [Bosea sp. (in: a-proteobacteria)]|nr:hypothetical protein [Bosea sp. (in: a-proteobacteria)]